MNSTTKVDVSHFAVFKHSLHLLSDRDGYAPVVMYEKPVMVEDFVTAYKADLTISTGIVTGYLKRVLVCDDSLVESYDSSMWDRKIEVEVYVEDVLWLVGDMDQKRIPVFAANLGGQHRVVILCRHRGSDEEEEYFIQITPAG